MGKKILIDYKLSLMRIGIIENENLKYLYTENLFDESLQNKVVQGQITDIVKHLKAVFVDFGEDKKGLLHKQQIPACYEGRITQGMRLPVKIIKEPTGEKGAKLTAMIDIPGEYSVCLPYEEGIGISKKIKDPIKKEELKQVVREVSSEYGWIIRTEAQNIPIEKLKEELYELSVRANQIKQMGASVSKGTVLYNEPFYIQMIKQHLQNNEEVIFECNEESLYTPLQQLSKALGLTGDIRVHPVYTDLFKALGFQKVYDEALRRKIWLKNGGNLVIEHTEAMTVVDVNSAKAIDKKDRNKSIKELNWLAFEEVIRQIFLRDLGGIILVDLVDFKESMDRKSFEEATKEFIRKRGDDSLKIYPLTELHLLQITRNRKRSPLSHKIYSADDCRQREYTDIYWLFKIEEEIQQIAKMTIYKEIYLFVHSRLKLFLQENKIIDLFLQRYGIKVHLMQEDKTKDFKITYHC